MLTVVIMIVNAVQIPFRIVFLRHAHTLRDWLPLVAFVFAGDVLLTFDVVLKLYYFFECDAGIGNIITRVDSNANYAQHTARTLFAPIAGVSCHCCFMSATIFFHHEFEFVPSSSLASHRSTSCGPRLIDDAHPAAILSSGRNIVAYLPGTSDPVASRSSSLCRTRRSSNSAGRRGVGEKG
jgi:hypothetical protein